MKIQPIVVMSIYRRACFFSCLLHLLIVIQLHPQIQYTFSALRFVHSSENMAQRAVSHTYRRVILGTTYVKNVKLTILISKSFLITLTITWLCIFLFCCGDVHLNPGPSSTTSTESFTSSSSSDSHLIHVCLIHLIRIII